MQRIFGKKLDQNGLAAITTTVVIMILVSLIVTSYSLVVRREQRQSLDRQLSSQAFYAAESGVQAALTALRAGAIARSITNCSGQDSFDDKFSAVPPVSKQPDLSNVEHSCVLVDIEPGSIVSTPGDPVGLSAGNVYRLQPVSDGGESTIKISWQAEDDRTDFLPDSTDSYELPGGGSSMPTPMLRVTLMNGRGDSQVMFLYPIEDNASGSPGKISYNMDSQASGNAVSGKCSASSVPYYCNVDILRTPLNKDNPHYIMIEQLYGQAKFSISAVGSDGGVLSLVGAQAVIDVTGRAGDVLRRIQVRVPITAVGGSGSLAGAPMAPRGALETTETLCKRLEVTASQVIDNCLSGRSYDLGSATP